MELYNIKDKMEYLSEIIELSKKEWGEKTLNEKEMKQYIDKKISKIKEYLLRKDYCKLVLLEKEKLVGFISIFPTDGDEREDLTPWYATMYIKKEYRGKGLSKILNDAILKEAKSRGYKKIYLKSNLKNYYEKFGAKYMQDLQNGEKLYYIEL